jgi:hypothetical protein
MQREGDHMSRRFLGAVALALASTAGLALLLGSLHRATATAIRTPDQVISLGVLVIGVLLLAWYLATAVVAVACVGARAAGRVWTVGERRLTFLGAPLARRLLVTGGSAAVVAASAFSPAVAAAAPADLGPSVTLADDLGWGAGDDTAEATTEEPPATSGEQPVPPGPAEPVSSSTVTATYTVVAGDSLWSIAERHLPQGASPSDIGTAWPRWYEHNLEAVGDDPDLIHPGQVLTVPDPHPQEEA